MGEHGTHCGVKPYKTCYRLAPSIVGPYPIGIFSMDTDLTPIGMGMDRAQLLFLVIEYHSDRTPPPRFPSVALRTLMLFANSTLFEAMSLHC